MYIKTHLRTFILTFISAFLFSAWSFGQGIQFFEGNWEQLKAEARKQHKGIFVDCYTSWCGPCKMLAKNTFPNKDVGDFYNANFVCYSMDMEKGEGPKIAQAFKVKFYPTLLYLDADGQMMHRSAGYQEADRFVLEGRTALDPNNNLSGRIKRFEAGEKDTTFLMELAIIIRNSDDKIQEEAMAKVWKQIPETELMSSYNWLRFKELDLSINSQQYDYIVAHKAEFEKKFGEELVDKTLFEKAAYSLQHAAEIKDEKLMKKAKAALEASNEPDIQKFAALGEMMYYKSNGDFKTFGKLAGEYIDKYAQNNADEINNIAFEAASGVEDKTLLKNAEKWVLMSINIKKTFNNMDIYAHVLYKLGKKKEAEQAAVEAIDLAQKQNADASSTKELLINIRNEK